MMTVGQNLIVVAQNVNRAGCGGIVPAIFVRRGGNRLSGAFQQACQFLEFILCRIELFA